MIRSFSRREKMSYSRSPRAVRSTTVGTRGMGDRRVAGSRYRPSSGSRARVTGPTRWLHEQRLRWGRTLDGRPMPTPALALTGLTKRYDNGFLALEAFDLDVPDGAF